MTVDEPEIEINILIVDDNERNIVAMNHVLADLPVTIHTAKSGEEALKLTLRNRYAVIYLDVQMPGMDGYEVASYLMQHKETAGIPVVFVSANGSELDHVTKGYESGAIDYLTKPVEPAFLLAKTKIFMRLFEQQEKLSKMLKELDKLASTDALTGLANRFQFNYAFEKLIELSKRNKRQFALLLLDLDDFKIVNDTYGHDVGDELLKMVAKRLSTILRHSDHIARLGGDEFAILLQEVSGPDVVSDLARNLIQAVVEPYRLGEQNIQIKTSLGIAIYPQDASVMKELFKAADIALYRAKDTGKNTFVYFNKTAS